MFSSSVINKAAPGSSNLTQHHKHQHLQVQSHSDIYSHNMPICSGLLLHNSNLVPGMVTRDGYDHVMSESTITFNSGFGNMPGSGSRVTKKKSDKRSKISTAQGLRDRRVRLSIGISRKFFDLQDLLGFDKPSKTVEWLLTRSNKDILELSAASSSSISFESAGTEDGFKRLPSSNSIYQIHQVSSDDSLKFKNIKSALLARESRAKARARARARTIAKLCISNLDQQKTGLLNNPEVDNGERQTLDSSNNCHNFGLPSFPKASTSKRQVEQPRGAEQPKHTQHFQMHSYGSNPSLSLDWDISSVIAQSSSSGDTETYARSSWDQLLNN